MKNILLTIAFFNTMLLSKVIKVNSIGNNEIKTEEDFINLIKDADSAQGTINFIKEQITGGDESENEKYVMPGFSVFIPDDSDNKKPKEIFYCDESQIS